MKINIKLAAIFASVTVSWLQPQLAFALTPSEVSKIAKEFTVLIDTQNPGSGVIIRKEGSTYYVLTAWHVVQYSDLPYTIQTLDGKRYKLDYSKIKRLPEVDLAVAQFTSEQTYSVARMSNSDQITEGVAVYISGFPNPGDGIQERIYRFKEGKISGIYSKPLAGGYSLVYDNVTRAGFSGGPVVDENARLIGVHGQGEVDRGSGSQSGNDNPTKTGYNMGIPINTFRSLAPKVGFNFDFQVESSPPVPTYNSSPPQPNAPRVSSPLTSPSSSGGVLRPKVPTSGGICPAGPGRC